MQAAAGIKSSGFCHSALITGPENEKKRFAGSGVYQFFCIYLFHSFLKGKKIMLSFYWTGTQQKLI